MVSKFVRPLVAAACVAGIFSASSALADGGKATIAVLPFEVGSVASFDETSVLVDAFNRVLVNTRKFTVVDRARVDRTRKEQKFGNSGLVGSRAAGAGRLMGAQFLVMGTLLDYSVEPPREMAYGSGWTRPVRISADIQIIDASTGQIVAARKAEGRSQRRVADQYAAGSLPAGALEDAATQVAESCVAALIDVAYPAKIVSVSGDRVNINRGDGGGLTTGTILNCFAAGKKMYDPDTKELLGTEQSQIGRIEVLEVLPTTSVARILEGDSLRVGDACRGDADLADAAGTHREPPPAGPIHSY